MTEYDYERELEAMGDESARAYIDKHLKGTQDTLEIWGIV
jgi:hypothetical protein